MEKENLEFFTRSPDATTWLFLSLRIQFLKFYQITTLKGKEFLTYEYRNTIITSNKIHKEMSKRKNIYIYGSLMTLHENEKKNLDSVF